MQINYDKINISLRLGIAIMFFVLVAIGLIGFDQLNKLAETRVSYVHTASVLSTLGSILEAAQDAETGQRGFLITGQESYLAPYVSAQLHMKESLAKFRQLVGNRPEHAENINALERVIQSKFAELAQTITLRRTNGQAAATAVVMTNQGKKHMDEIRTLIAQMKEKEEALLAMHGTELDKRAQVTLFGLLFFCGLAIAFQTITSIIIMNFLRARKEAEANLNAVHSSIAEGLLQVDINGNLVYINPAAEKIFGYKLAEIKGKSPDDLINRPVNTAREQKHQDEHRLLNVMKTGIAHHEADECFVRKDGSLVPVEYTSAPLMRDNEIVGAVVCFQDITERKEIERRVSEFYSTVSHELRTPLTSIRGTLSLMEKGRLGELPPRAQNLTKIALAESERLVRLINDILDMKKIEAGKLELRLEDLDASEIINNTFQALASMAQEFSVRLVSEINTASNIYGDHDRIIQVLTNLISNAIKFSPPDTEIMVQATNISADIIRFSVIDKGPGIRSEELPKLFGLFQQLDSSDSRPKGGTGLGLTISKAIVEQHGGKIGIDSTFGQGSTFWFELPVQPRKKPVVRKSLPAKHKVLLVEDDHHLCLVLSEALASEGYQVDEASSLKEATEYLSSQDMPALILLDIQLPDGNGLELLQQLRKQALTNSIPVVIITGSETSAGEYADPFLIDWIKKPFEIERLLGSLKLATSDRTPGRTRVLVVDDDAPTRELIKQQLQSFDIEFLEAPDGFGAVHLARTNNPDLIILDLTMPKPDGFDVVQILRDEKNQTTPLLIYTSRDLTNEDKEKLTLGLSAYLTKSRTSEEQFLNTVKNLLNGLLPGMKKENEKVA